ncbi:anaerobic C4-dicarboxylate transporter family protein [Parasutterella muris]|uniref:C4-dicarboxylate transporter n=1 Tax=Parasutterella muris TaxID=2565572 RepID=A0A6L6YIL2_9BURK|nr:anaerobic C4-dicarboxylate transporter family protein [Parasutterella muris]MVX56589.1 anaerobic C4-dicarboxylate transporter [Parasutterella muris]
MITLIELLIVFAAIFMGVRHGSLALGFWGGLGLIVLAVGFGVFPTAPPIDVMLIILAVCMCASCMEAVGGLEILVRIAARVIRAKPKMVGIIAPVVSFFLTFFAGTGNAVYAILPVIYEVSYNAGVRPEKAMAGAAVAGQVGITASPIAAAMAAMIGLFAQNGHGEIGLGSILMITFPACLIGVVVGSAICMLFGKDLKNDPAYQARLKAGLVLPPEPISNHKLPPQATYSVFIFLGAIIVIVLAGFFPELRVLPGQTKAVGMSLVIESVMLAAGAIMMLLCKPDVKKIVKSPVLEAGIVSLGCVFGVAWMADSFIAANKDVFMSVAGQLAQAAPWLFSFILAGMSALLASQGATTRAIMPLGFALGINPWYLIAMFPAVNCLFILPTSGPALAAVGMDRSGTTYIGKYVINHSFQLPGILMVVIAVISAFCLVSLVA